MASLLLCSFAPWLRGGPGGRRGPIRDIWHTIWPLPASGLPLPSSPPLLFHNPYPEIRLGVLGIQLDDSLVAPQRLVQLPPADDTSPLGRRPTRGHGDISRPYGSGPLPLAPTSPATPGRRRYSPPPPAPPSEQRCMGAEVLPLSLSPCLPVTLSPLLLRTPAPPLLGSTASTGTPFLSKGARVRSSAAPPKNQRWPRPLARLHVNPPGPLVPGNRRRPGVRSAPAQRMDAIVAPGARPAQDRTRRCRYSAPRAESAGIRPVP